MVFSHFFFTGKVLKGCLLDGAFLEKNNITNPWSVLCKSRSLHTLYTYCKIRNILNFMGELRGLQWLIFEEKKKHKYSSI